MSRLRRWIAAGLGPWTRGSVPDGGATPHRDGALERLYRALVTPPPEATALPGAACVILSRNRAIQLHALLRSYRELVRTPAPVHLLYRADTARHRDAYREALAPFDDLLAAVREEDGRTSFKAQVIEILAGLDPPKVFFLMDDDLFIRPVDLADFCRPDPSHYVPTLRLGRNIRRSYALGVDQPLPRMREAEGRPDAKLCWRWADGTGDWAYPLSLDGHLFSTREVLAMARAVDFRGPNTLEARIERDFGRWYRMRLGLAYPTSVLVNIPANRVQDEIPNRHGSQHQDSLLDLWHQGLEIDVARLRGSTPRSAHEALTFDFVPRGAG